MKTDRQWCPQCGEPLDAKDGKPIKIARVQYDGKGRWVDVGFSNGETFRYSKASLLHIGRVCGTPSDKSFDDWCSVSIKEGEVEKRP